MRHTSIRRALFSGVAASIIGASALISSSPAMADQVFTANMTGASATECQAPFLSQPFLNLRTTVTTPSRRRRLQQPRRRWWQFFGGAHIVQTAVPTAKAARSTCRAVDGGQPDHVRRHDVPDGTAVAKTITDDGDVTVAVSYAVPRPS